MSSALLGAILAVTPLALLAAMTFVLRQQMQIGLFAWTIHALFWLVFLHLFSGRFMPWYWIGESSRLAFTVTAVVLVALCYRNQSEKDWLSKGSFWGNTALALMLGCVVFADLWLGANADAQFDLESPVKGSHYYVVQGGNNRFTNHHHTDPVQRFAVDIVVIDGNGRRARGINPRELSSYFSFNYPLLAPCSGIVKAALNRFDDLQLGYVDAQNPAGNYVLIACANYDILLAHLKKESAALMKVGDAVNSGQLVGHIGNSGNSTEPHLHMHVVRDANKGDSAFPLSGIGVPFTLNNRKMTRGNFD